MVLLRGGKGDIFPNIMKRFMVWVVLYAWCLKKKENYLEKNKIGRFTSLQGVWKSVKTHYNP